jgi:uncharacterized integral membrane protein
LRYLLIALLASAVTVFALQNNTPVQVSFLVWDYDGIPLATVILGSVVAGAVLAGVPLWIGRWRLRSRARTLESRVATLEASRVERDRPPPPPPLGGPPGSPR